MRRRRGILSHLVRAVLAGLAGTAAMTLHQELRSALKDGSGSSGGEGGDPWEEAPAPAQVARMGLGAVGVEPSPERIPLLTNLLHWGYGTAWGTAFALARPHLPGSALALGPAFGLTMWGASYAQLVPLGLYEPPWTYDATTLANDVGYHLTFGTATALAATALR